MPHFKGNNTVTKVKKSIYLIKNIVGILYLKIVVPITPVISAETLLIAAKDDIIINPNDIKKLSQGIHNGQISTIDAAGHNFEKTQNQTDLYLAIYNFLQ